ncbi:MAG: RNA methyltransferase [Fimbriimonadaceae bacterium]|nr:RNA methyltransferase [Fimbriimonadaceae bacterium]
MAAIQDPREPAFVAAAELTTALGRAARGQYLVEGEKLVRQALAAQRLESVLLLPSAADLASELRSASVPLLTIAPRLLTRLSGTDYETAVTAVGVARRELLPQAPGRGLLLLAENIQDPRNVGVLLRTAEAAGCAALVLGDRSADPFGRPAVRSSTGSILRQPLVLCADLPAELARLQAAGVRVYGSSARATASAWEADLRGPLGLLVGNESSGLEPATAAACEALLRLPMHGAASSLNVTVAAGALLYEALRQRADDREPTRCVDA